MTKRPIATSASGAAKKSASAIAAAEKREAQRKQFMELRRKNKMATPTETQQSADNIAIVGNHGSELEISSTPQQRHDENHSYDKADR